LRLAPASQPPGFAATSVPVAHLPSTFGTPSDTWLEELGDRLSEFGTPARGRETPSVHLPCSEFPPSRSHQPREGGSPVGCAPSRASYLNNPHRHGQKRSRRNAFRTPSERLPYSRRVSSGRPASAQRASSGRQRAPFSRDEARQPASSRQCPGQDDFCATSERLPYSREVVQRASGCRPASSPDSCGAAQCGLVTPADGRVVE
jgi:hypothetical protein